MRAVWQAAGKSHRLGLVWAGVTIAGLLLFAGCGRQPGEEANPKQVTSADRGMNELASDPPDEPPRGSWVPVRRGTLRRFHPAIGTFRARQTTQIGPQVAGRVESVLVDVGDQIKKGQELVRLDPAFFKIEAKRQEAAVQTARVHLQSSKQEVQTAQAEVERSQAILADADLQLSRMKDLWEKPKGETPTISKRQYDDAIFKHQEAKAGLDVARSRLAESKVKVEAASFELSQAQQSLEYAEQRLRETVIDAPYDAVVTKRLVDPGEPVGISPPTHLLEIQEVGTLELEFSLPQNMLSQVPRGTPVEFQVEGIDEERHPGRISTVYPDLDQATRSFRCRVLVDNADLTFRPGLLAQVFVLIQAAEDTLIVPPEALAQTASGWQVTISNQGRPTPHPVEIGLLTEEGAQVLSGLTEGMQVLVVKNSS